MTNQYTLVLTGKILPGYTSEAVWMNLAEMFRVAPDKRQQLRARVPQIIKQSSDLGKLQALQERIAQMGAQTELYPPDERPAMFVLPADGDTPRGLVPNALVRQYLARGVWTADALRVALADSTTWVPYHEFDVAPVPPPVPPRPAPASVPVMAATRPASCTAPRFRRDEADDQILDVLPAGKAIHAGFWRRYAAWMLDGFIIFIPVIILSLMPILGGILGIIVQWLYFALMESSSWQATLGKRAMGIKVVDERGHRIGFGRATGRYFGQILSGIIFCIGFMMAGWTERKQGLHDLMAGTFVVFKGVQPGQPLPDKRPPMPWYGWALVLALPFIVMFVAIVGPAVMNKLGGAKSNTAVIQIADIDKALDLFKLDVGRYPTNVEGLQALVDRPPTANGWNGPYLKGGLPTDPWGNAYHYANPGPNGGVQILSLGADNAPGGEGENADIVNQP